MSQKMAGILAFVFMGWASAADPPGLAIAGSEPQAAATPGTVTVAAGRFVPLAVAGGKPALVLGNEAKLLEMFPLPAGHSIIGVRYDEPAGAKAKRYTFPGGAVTIALAGDVGGTVTLTSVVNGASASEAPTVAGTLVLTLTAPLPPPGPGPIPPGPGPGPGPIPPGPGPGPIPPGPIPPGPGPTPQPVTSFRVLFDTESANALTVKQNAVIGAAAVQKYLNDHCTKDGTTPGWRSFDPQTTAANEYPAIKALWAAVQPKVTTIPCWIIEVNGNATILPYPASAADALTTLKQYGGQ